MEAFHKGHERKTRLLRGEKTLKVARIDDGHRRLATNRHILRTLGLGPPHYFAEFRLRIFELPGRRDFIAGGNGRAVSLCLGAARPAMVSPRAPPFRALLAFFLAMTRS